MSPHGTKGSSKKAMSKSVSMIHNGPRMSSKKKRKLANENSDPEVLDRSAKYWHAIKMDSINEKILKHLSAPSRRYKLKDEESVLPAQKKRKLQKNGGLETDSDDEKNSKKERFEMKKKLQSKLRKLKRQNLDSELAAVSGVKNKSKKSLYGNACAKGKKSRQKLLSANYEDLDGVCIYELDVPELKNKSRKKLMAERAKGANHLLNKKKVRVGKGVLTPKNLTKKQKPTIRIDAAKFKVLSKSQQNKIYRKYSVQLVSDAEGSDSDSSPDKDVSGSSCKKSLAKITRLRWADLNKKAAKLKMQELELPKSKKFKRQQVSEEDEDDSEDDDDDDLSSEEEDLSDDDMLEEEEEEDDDDDEDEDDEEDDDDDSSEEHTNDEKSRQGLKLSNGDWENVAEDVGQDAAYGNGWKPQEDEKPSSSSSSSSLLQSWSQNNDISANNYHHLDPLVSQQQQPHQLMQAGNVPAQTMSRPMTNSSNLLPPFGVVVDTATSQQHYPNQIQDSSTQALQQQLPSYNVYGGVDYSSQAATPSYNSERKPSATQSANVHLQQQLHQSQTHSFNSGFNHLQSQQNNSSNVQRVKYYYPAYIGKNGIIEVEEALRPMPPEEVLTNGFRISIKRCDMATLVGSNWLNDEVINFYMNLIVQRGKMEGFNSVYIPSTFFFPMVMKRGYSSVRRWTKNVDIFDHDLMLIPIHLEMENHWTLIAVDFLQSSICYYDSYLQDKDEAMDAILEYLKEEMKSKKNIDMDVNCWVKVNMKNIPLQENLSDCGVFSCIYAEYISRGAQMDFTQEDMPYFRRKMVYEILHHKITVNSPRDTENLISDDLIQDMCPAPKDVPNLLEPPASLENGLPDSSLSPISNDNSMKVNEENAALTRHAKKVEEDDDDKISKDSDTSQSSSDAEGEHKMSGDEEHKKKYSSAIVAEMKQIANAFEDANAKEQEILLNRLRHLQKSYSRILKQKNKHKHKVGHQSLKDLILLGKDNSEMDDSDISITSSTSSSSSSSSGSTSTASGSSEEETKSSDDANMSSNSDSHDQIKLSRITWEVEKLLMSFTDVVRSIGKASNRFSVSKRLLDPSGSFSVIKGMEYISSELQNISNHYDQMLNESPKKTAVKKQVSRSPSNATKMQQKRVLKCIASQLSVRQNKFKRKVLKRLRAQRASDTTKANVIPKKVASGYGEFYQAELIDRQLLSPLVKDAGGRLLKSPPCTQKLQLQESLLTKFPMPDGSFDLTGSTSENSRKQQAHKNLLRSDHGKKGKKKNRVWVERYEDRALVIIQHPFECHLLGSMQLCVIAGCINILGAKLTTNATMHPVYSPTSHMLLKLTTEQPIGKGVSKIMNYLSFMFPYTDHYVDHINPNVVILLVSSLNCGFTDWITTINPYQNLFNAYPKAYKIPYNKHLKPFGISLLKRPSMVTTSASSSEMDEFFRKWPSILENSDCPKMLLCGGKNVGKSTVARTLINMALETKKAVCFLDCDPGQTEFTPPGCVSLNVVKKFVFGPPFCHQEDPEFNIFIGEVSPENNSNHYMMCIRSAMEYYLRMPEQFPLIINTMGWVTGPGKKMLDGIINLTSPDHIVLLKHNRYRIKYSDLIPSTIAKNQWNFYGETAEQLVPSLCEWKVTVLRSVVKDIVKVKSKLSNPELRTLSILSYLAKTCSLRVSLSHNIPYKIQWNSLAIYICHEIVPPNQILYAINASVVALCNADMTQTSHLKGDENLPRVFKKRPICKCLGFGFVRGIQVETQMLYIVSPLPMDVISEVNTLMRGSITLPLETLQTQNSRDLKYVDNTIEAS